VIQSQCFYTGSSTAEPSHMSTSTMKHIKPKMMIMDGKKQVKL